MEDDIQKKLGDLMESQKAILKKQDEHEWRLGDLTGRLEGVETFVDRSEAEKKRRSVILKNFHGIFAWSLFAL